MELCDLYLSSAITMLGVLAKYIQDVSVIRRLLFAVVFLTPDLPMYWGVVIEFATAGKVSVICYT